MLTQNIGRGNALAQVFRCRPAQRGFGSGDARLARNATPDHPVRMAWIGLAPSRTGQET